MHVLEKRISEHKEHPRLSRQIFQVYLGTDDVDSEIASKILDRLNSLNSAEELMSVAGSYAGRNVLGIVIAQRIFNMKTKIGKFQDLNQVATVPGIGRKRFIIIMSALGDRI
jgi:DNA uptake protein ComE-like DNA-binding protein